MNKLIFMALLLCTFEAFSQEELGLETSAASTPALISSAETDLDNRVFKPYRNHWLTSFGFEYGKYEVPWNFRGEKKNLAEKDQELMGGRIGFGKEIYLNKGFMTTSKIEGFYQGSLFTSAINAAPEEKNIEFASTKNTGNLYGLELSQSISYLFDMKTRNPFMGEWTYLTVEPFIEAGLGRARSYQSVNYKYLLDTVREYYKERISDDITTTKLSVGINFTSTTGYFLFLKATQSQYDVTSRETRRTIKQNADPTPTSTKTKSSNVDMDPVMVYALGGGYKF